MAERRMQRGLLDPESEAIAEAYEAGPAVRRQLRGLLDVVQRAFSLEPQEQTGADIALDVAAGFTPLQYPQAARDFERARREGDPFGMGLATLTAVPVIGGVARAAGKARKGVDIAAERADALRIAQENAAKPISEGGLGLPPSNTPQERMAALGYEPFAHGTERLDRLLQTGQIDPRRATSGPMPFGTSSEPLASNYAMSKHDTSRIAQDTGEFENYYQTEAKNVGGRGSRLINVERTFYSLPPKTQQTIRERISRIGYKNPDLGEGPLMLHDKPGSSITSNDHINFILNRESGGNPLTALRKLWLESGQLYGNEEEMAKIYKLAGYPHEITQTNAPWTQAKGVLTGAVRMTNPLNTQDTALLQEKVLPALKEAVKGDRTRLKRGADPWAKESRFTPKEWVAELERDISAGRNSHVWTSIPDKITKALKDQGFDGIRDISGKSGAGDVQSVLIPFEPSQVRSRFAAFDPAKIGSPDLLAGIAGPTVLAAAIMEQQRREQERNRGGL